MLLALAFLISFGSSEVSYKDSVLTISNEESITSTLINDYKAAKTCKITSDGTVSIQRGAFDAFTSLDLLSIEVSTINFESQSFQQATGIKKITIRALDSINIAQSTFLLAEVDYIELYAQKQITLGQQSFQQTSKMSQIELYCNGTVTISESAFMKSLVKNIHIESKEDVVLEQQSFQQCEYITSLEIESKESGITFGQSSFQSSTLGKAILKSRKDIIFGQQSMQEVTNFSNLIVETQGNFLASQHSFLHSTIICFSIFCHGTATFEQQTFQQTPNLNNFTVISNGSIEFAQHSFLQSKVNSMQLQTNSSINFGQQCFQETTQLITFTINSTGEIYFGDHSFIDSNVHSIYIETTDSITFTKQSFQNCRQLNTFVIETTSDVTFGQQSFHNSQACELIIKQPNSASAKLQASQPTITFEKQSFSQCERLQKIDISYSKGNVDIQSGSFKNSKSLDNVKINADSAHVASYAFSGCNSLDKADITANNKDISDNAYAEGDDDDDDDSGNNKKSGSSHKDNDDDSQTNAKALGNIQINSVYLGTSPNIYLNLNFILSLMKNARKIFGHLIPSPEMVHSAIWICQNEIVNDDSIGAIFVYGKYWNEKKLESYINHDGAKACVMSLGDFKKRYPAIQPMKLDIHNKLNLFEFIELVKNSGNWRAKDYNWPTNNCQHFTAKLINILMATRNAPNSDDWIDLPKQVLNSLKENENK